ncbi:hypothetical protein Q8A73_005387 [Channa argus]|nr:hypothetical protein Q8A73_005387 [Channa argus]
MTPQLYITVYKEQFASPARVKRAELRPTSAHRRNNPQPRPDFLFPRSLQPSYRAANTQPHPSLPELSGRPLFPPIRQLSFHSPVTTSPGNCLNAVCLGGPQHMPPVNSAAELDLPSVRVDKADTQQHACIRLYETFSKLFRTTLQDAQRLSIHLTIENVQAW